MNWNVYYYNFNAGRIETFNIFKHGAFVKHINEYCKDIKDKSEFANAVKRELRYFFWSKSEWELIIELTEDNRIFLTPFIGCRNPEEAKIDVTNDTSLDWNGFAKEHINKQIHKNEAKIDVHDQIVYTWDNFLEYIWNNKEKVGYINE